LIDILPESALDWPVDEIPDGMAVIRAAIDWHFDQNTGSPFWLDRARTLDFDPRTDVRSFEDLRRFPNVVNELRDVPVRDLVPRGYGGRVRVTGVFESGGTTGVPKRVLLLGDWEDRYLEWVSRRLDERGFPRDLDFLVLAPTGPHVMGQFAAELARRRGGIPYHVDMDPRWVKKCISAGHADRAAAYADHLVEQAGHVLGTQQIGAIVTTPPLLERMAEQDHLVEAMNKHLQAIYWGGASIDADTEHLLRTEVFPDVQLHSSYGGTMGMCPTVDRMGLADDEPRVFDPFSPHITFTVVDPETGRPVPYGERGQVVMNHVSRSMFIPNNDERDLATRVPPRPGQLGDSLSEVAPFGVFGGEEVIEGVY
jgi:phenylacetate-coenzyme A ligase PaaK-like adenylate-forming protein